MDEKNQRIVSVENIDTTPANVDPFKLLRMLGATPNFDGVDIDRVHSWWVNENAT